MRATEQLEELIKKKHQVLVRLREVGKRQMTFVSNRDTASLIKLLAVKQNLIASLQAIERELSPFSTEDPEERLWKSPAARADCAALAAECNCMLRDVVDLEKNSVDQMTHHRNEIAQQLQQVRNAIEVRIAYQAQR